MSSKNDNCDRCGNGLVVTSDLNNSMLCGPCDNEIYDGYKAGIKDPYYTGNRWKKTTD